MIVKPMVKPTEYIVSALALDDPNADLFWITVAWRGVRRPEFSPTDIGDWAVTWHGYCLDRQDRWEHEPQPSSRTHDWMREHRWTFTEALAAAKRMVPTIVVNGLVVVDGKVVARA